MLVGASPSPKPARGVPGKAVQLSSRLHFLLAACGSGGTRVHLASVAPFLWPTRVAPGTVLTPHLALLSGSPNGGCARGRGTTTTTTTSGFVASRFPLLAATSLPFLRGPGRLLGVMFLGRRAENSFWFRTSTTMSGRVDGGGGAYGSGSGGEAKGGDGPASQDANSVPAASREGAESGGEAKSGDFPVVTLDEDAVQKFAEIEVRWGGDKSSEPTILIRGLKSAEYHVEAAEPTMQRLREAGVEATITGGGRIKHSSKRRSVFIYGYSMQFGPANLPRVADLCRKQFGPEYEVTWTEGGY
eukprot:g6507.t1